MSSSKQRKPKAGTAASRPSAFQPFSKPISQITVVDPVDAERADYVICMRLADATPTMMHVPQNLVGRCSRCNERVIFSAKSAKTPPRLCLVCYEAQPPPEESASGETEEAQHWVTQAILEETLLAIAAADAEAARMRSGSLLNREANPPGIVPTSLSIFDRGSRGLPN
jgi:hypothetical protein